MAKNVTVIEFYTLYVKYLKNTRITIWNTSTLIYNAEVSYSVK